MASHTYTKPGADLSRLQSECLAAGLPVTHLGGSGDGVTVFTSRDLTAGEVVTLDSVVTAHDGRPRRKRTIYAIYTAIGALTATQQSAIWTDLTTGTPPKWATDAGPNAAAIAAIHWSAANSGATAANLNDARRRLAAMYAQDNPGYLVAPAFDPSINVSGDEAATAG